jgi:hypothetical protein
LHEKCYEKAKELFNLNTALIQTARDKAVEILKGFEENRKKKAFWSLKGLLSASTRDATVFPRQTTL